jgi:hypothetical protein
MTVTAQMANSNPATSADIYQVCPHAAFLDVGIPTKNKFVVGN